MIPYKYIDHTAYVFHSIEDGVDFFNQHHDVRYLYGPGVNHIQDVMFIFLSVKDLGKVEILSPLSKDSPVLKRLNTVGPGPYHVCYCVENINDSIEQLICSDDWSILSQPKPDPAFSERKVSFLYSKKFGIIELLEFQKTDYQYIKPISQIQPREIREKVSIPSQICELIPHKDGDSLELVTTFEDIPDWDSLSMAIFHSSFEELVGESIELYPLKSLQEYIDFYKRIMV